MTATQVRPAVTDPRVNAICSAGPEVFSGIVHQSQIWSPDPFDVEAIHAEARDGFHRLVGRASAPTPPAHGKSLLLLGESGSGKTHLLRAFRADVHESGAGYCGYLQLLTRMDDYARYILSGVIDSLEQPYRPGDPVSGLTRLARGLLDAIEVVPMEERRRLYEDALLEPDETARLVFRLADAAVQDPRFAGIDIDLIRGLLFVVANDVRIRPRVLKWLRCEDLGRFDREFLGDLVARPGPEMPLRTLIGLGRLMHSVHSAAFVVMVDQMEEVINMDQLTEAKGEVLRRVVSTVVDVMDGIPNAVVVLACLDDLFVVGKPLLPKPKLDRLERDPEPIRLTSKRSRDDVAALLRPRLEAVFEAAGVRLDPANPLAPYTPVDLEELVGLRTRDVIDQFRCHRETCVREGKWVKPWAGVISPPPSRPADWEQRWNDWHNAYKTPILDDENKLAELLAFAITTTSAEMPDGVYFAATPNANLIAVDVHPGGSAVDPLYVAVCDMNARGGGLGKQVEKAAKAAGEIPVVLVRSTEFPSSPNAVVTRDIVKLVKPKGRGRKVVVSNSDWRAMAAFREFHAKHKAEPGFAAWQKAERPLAELPAVTAILDLNTLLAQRPVSGERPLPPPPPPAVVQKVVADAPVRLGHTRGAAPAPVELKPKDLCRHAAFLGGSGSGKTTAALAIIEELLLAGVPAVLIDRKGDLARYADPAAWTTPEPDPERANRRERLRAAVDVALYTPGASADAGRPLAIPVVPDDLAQLSADDREQTARFAAASLGLMMGYRSKSLDPKRVILQKAIEVLARTPGRAITMDSLQQLVVEMDDTLTLELQGYEAKEYRTLGRDLLTLKHSYSRLLDRGERLDVDALLGRGLPPGRTRLAVVNTQFLGDADTIDFWVSQFLLTVDRWRAKNPADSLRAVFLFDEAEKYLPASNARQPATKGPMESLLRRARSAGIGLFLATQNPGDFDYRCRDQIVTWLVGKLTQKTGIDKLKPVLERRPEAADKLAGQKAGEFYLVREGDVTPVAAARNLIPTEQVPEDRILTLARPG